MSKTNLKAVPELPASSEPTSYRCSMHGDNGFWFALTGGETAGSLSETGRRMLQAGLTLSRLTRLYMDGPQYEGLDLCHALDGIEMLNDIAERIFAVAGDRIASA